MENDPFDSLDDRLLLDESYKEDTFSPIKESLDLLEDQIIN